MAMLSFVFVVVGSSPPKGTRNAHTDVVDCNSNVIATMDFIMLCMRGEGGEGGRWQQGCYVLSPSGLWPRPSKSSLIFTQMYCTLDTY